MAKIPYIVTTIAVVLAALSAILNRFWTGFVYFTLSCLLILSFFWGAWQIFKYFTDFKFELEEKFKYFKADKINSKGVSSEVFEASLPAYKKEFKKKILKDKILKWFVILFCFAVGVAFLVAMIFDKQPIID